RGRKARLVGTCRRRAVGRARRRDLRFHAVGSRAPSADTEPRGNGRGRCGRARPCDHAAGRRADRGARLPRGRAAPRPLRRCARPLPPRRPGPAARIAARPARPAGRRAFPRRRPPGRGERVRVLGPHQPHPARGAVLARRQPPHGDASGGRGALAARRVRPPVPSGYEPPRSGRTRLRRSPARAGAGGGMGGRPGRRARAHGCGRPGRNVRSGAAVRRRPGAPVARNARRRQPRSPRGTRSHPALARRRRHGVEPPRRGRGPRLGLAASRRQRPPGRRPRRRRRWIPDRALRDGPAQVRLLPGRASAATFAIVLALTVSGGRSARSALGPRYGGELRIALAESATTLAPSVPRSLPERILAGLVHEVLVDVDDDGRPRPALVQSWASAADGREWTLRLAPATFHDGTAVGSADAVRGLRRFLQADSVAAAHLARVLDGGDDFRRRGSEALPGLTAIDEARIVLRFRMPTAVPLAPLASPAAAIVSPRGAGAGPFVPTTPPSARGISATAFGRHVRGRPFLDVVRLVAAAPDRVSRSEVAIP